MCLATLRCLHRARRHGLDACGAWCTGTLLGCNGGPLRATLEGACSGDVDPRLASLLTLWASVRVCEVCARPDEIILVTSVDGFHTYRDGSGRGHGACVPADRRRRTARGHPGRAAIRVRPL